MPLVVPSQVVELIDQMFPWAAVQKVDDVRKNPLNREDSPRLAGIVAMIEKVPSELLTVQGQSYVELVISLAAIKDRLRLWQGQECSFTHVSGPERLNPVTLIRRALAQCSDEPVPSANSGLVFIPREDLRLSLLGDISAMNRALANGEWKAATVLAGSVLEALLLWRLEQAEDADVKVAKENVLAKKRLFNKPSEDLQYWHLVDYIEVALELRAISERVAIQCRLAKEFRNLIHPGREARLGQTCNRGTALSAVSAVELLVVHLSINGILSSQRSNT